MPGFHAKMVLPGYSHDYATVGEVVMGISGKDTLFLRSMRGLHRKQW